MLQLLVALSDALFSAVVGLVTWVGRGCYTPDDIYHRDPHLHQMRRPITDDDSSESEYEDNEDYELPHRPQRLSRFYRSFWDKVAY